MALVSVWVSATFTGIMHGVRGAHVTRSFHRLPRACNVSGTRSLAATRLHIETPLVRSDPMSARLGADVWLKLDCLQPSGSFKLRGMGETVCQAFERGSKRVVSSSGGNAGLAIAYAARAVGVGCTVVVPETTPAQILERLRFFGATVEVHGAFWDQANQRAGELAVQQEAAFVHPFDQPSSWKGHATLVHEIRNQLQGEEPDAFVTCVGGGGLLMGILQGLDEVGWTPPVVACETVGASSMAQSLAAGSLVTLPGIASVAKSLGAATVGKAIFERCLALGPRVVPWTMNDAAAVRACALFARDHRILVEPACGAALAAVYERSPALQGKKRVVVEVCGGGIVDVDMLATWMAELNVSV